MRTNHSLNVSSEGAPATADTLTRSAMHDFGGGGLCDDEAADEGGGGRLDGVGREPPDPALGGGSAWAMGKDVPDTLLSRGRRARPSPRVPVCAVDGRRRPPKMLMRARGGGSRMADGNAVCETRLSCSPLAIP